MDRRGDIRDDTNSPPQLRRAGNKKLTHDKILDILPEIHDDGSKIPIYRSNYCNKTFFYSPTVSRAQWIMILSGAWIHYSRI